MISLEPNLYAKVSNHRIAFWNATSMEIAYIKTCSHDLSQEDITAFVSDLRKQDVFCALSGDGGMETMDSIGSVNISQMVLLVTNTCNYDCVYCQIERNIPDRNKVHMTKETASMALTFFKANADLTRKKTLTITGGEPLLNLDVVKYVVSQARLLFDELRIVMFTNGALVDEDIASFLYENGVLALVSLDGPASMHDATRIDHFGQGTFERTLNGYQTLVRARCQVGVSSVGGVHNKVQYDHLLNFFLSLKPKSLGYNIPHFLLEEVNPFNLPVIEFTKILLRLYVDLRNEGIYLENISRIINAFAMKKPKISECQAQGRGFTVDARGMIGPCKSLVINDIYSVKMSESLDISTLPLFRQWATRSPFKVEHCLRCPAKSLCGGGCAYDSHVRFGDFMKMDDRVCEYQISILEFLIDDLYASIEGDVVEGTPYVPSVNQRVRAFSKYFESDNGLQRSVGHE